MEYDWNAGAVFPRAWDGMGKYFDRNPYDYPTADTDIYGKDRFRPLIPMSPKITSARPADLADRFKHSLAGTAEAMPSMAEGATVCSLRKEDVQGHGLVEGAKGAPIASQPQVPARSTMPYKRLRPGVQALSAMEAPVYEGACMTKSCTQEMMAARGHIRPNMRTLPARNSSLGLETRTMPMPQRPLTHGGIARPANITNPQHESHQLRGEEDGVLIAPRPVEAAGPAPFVERDLRQAECFQTTTLLNDIRVRSGRADPSANRQLLEALVGVTGW